MCVLENWQKLVTICFDRKNTRFEFFELCSHWQNWREIMNFNFCCLIGLGAYRSSLGRQGAEQFVPTEAPHHGPGAATRRRGGTGGSNRGPAATTRAPPAIAQFVYRGIGDRTIFTGRPLLSPSIWSRFFWAQRSCENLTKASGTEETAKKSCSKMVESFLRGFSLFA